ncbi:MAG: hypothetical protein AB7V27_14180 [Candidatus Binatia bacterium]
MCFLASPASAQPNNSWVDASLVVGTVSDCSGSSSQTDTAQALPCQSYNADLYESLEYTASVPQPADDADIQLFRAGADANFLYVEWDLAADWDVNTSTSHHFIIEVDVDPDMETTRGDNYV